MKHRMRQHGSGTISPGEGAAPCTAETAQVGDRDRRDEDEGRWRGRGTILPLGSDRHGEQGRELLCVALTPTRDGRDAYCFIRRALQAVHEHANGARGRGPVVFVGIEQVGRAMGGSV